MRAWVFSRELRIARKADSQEESQTQARWFPQGQSPLRFFFFHRRKFFESQKLTAGVACGTQAVVSGTKASTRSKDDSAKINPTKMTVSGLHDVG